MKWNGWDNLHAISNNMLKESGMILLILMLRKLGDRREKNLITLKKNSFFFSHI